MRNIVSCNSEVLETGSLRSQNEFNIARITYSIQNYLRDPQQFLTDDSTMLHMKLNRTRKSLNVCKKLPTWQNIKDMLNYK